MKFFTLLTICGATAAVNFPAELQVLKATIKMINNDNIRALDSDVVDFEQQMNLIRNLNRIRNSPINRDTLAIAEFENSISEFTFMQRNCRQYPTNEVMREQMHMQFEKVQQYGENLIAAATALHT